MRSDKRKLRDSLLQATCPQPELSDSQFGQLERYLETLLLWNERTSLVSQRDVPSIVCKHFIDSLVVATRCVNTERVVDLGSGAGFPGLVIAIARPDDEVCLVESRAKKVSFLLEVRRICGLSNVRVIHARIEDVNRDGEEGRHTLAVSRALTDVGTFVALAKPLLQKCGRLIAMRVPGLAAKSENPTVHLDEDFRYQLPDGSARSLLMFHVEQ